MKHIIGAMLLLALLAMSGCTVGGPEPATSTEQGAASDTASATAPGTAPASAQASADGAASAAPAAQPALALSDGLVVADARVVPMRSIATGFRVPGVVAEILVQEGDRVSRETPLMRLDEQQLQLNVDEARVTVTEAKAAYEQLIAGATPEEVAAARARLERAQADLQSTTGQVVPEAIKATQSELKALRTELARLQAGPRETDVQGQRAEIAEAEAQLEATRDRFSSEKTLANTEVEKAADLLRMRQAEYSGVYWEMRRIEGSRELRPDEAAAESRALLAMQIAERDLAQARVVYDTAVQQEINQIAAATSRLEAANARMERLLAGPDPDEIERVRARIAAAEARLAQLQGDEREGSLGSSAASVEIAQAELDRVLAGPRTGDVANAEARLARAEVALKRAELALELATLRSPIDGVVGQINTTVGENIADTGRPLITIADNSSWLIETANLSELAVVSVREGDPAAISFYALPGFELTGKVQQIRPVGASQGRDTVYTVVIAPDAWDDRLLWNMTASVRISPQR